MQLAERRTEVTRGEGVAEAVQGIQAIAGHAAQDTPWAADTSGFGVSKPADLAEPAPARGWFKPARWLRSASPRSGG